MNTEPFFRKQGDSYIATPISRSPWSPTMLHGRVIAGLLAFQIEHDYGSEAMLPARLTVDMYRAPDFSPITIKTSLVRDGRRIKVVDAEFISNGVSMGRASCQLLLRTTNPPGNIWMPPSWQVPKPAEITQVEKFPGGIEATWLIKNISGVFGTCAQRRVWMSETRELVEGVPITPWMRVALAADFASPCANVGDAGIGYINSDATVYLHRLPRGEWIGMETINHGATDGIAVGECFIYDEEGPIGSSSVTALAQQFKQ